MAIKLIAVDMDGTFLNREMTYNKTRFAALYKKMKEQGIKFVAASGNPLPQLTYYFADVKEEITYIAENGAYIVERGKELDSVTMDRALADQVIDTLRMYSDKPFVLCGKKKAYVPESISEESYAFFNRYYPLLERASGLHEIDDEFFKFATSFEELEVPHVLEYLHGELDGKMLPVASGFGFVDLILPGIDKGRGIRNLQKHWGITKEESAAFGDSPNDLEMLQEVKYSFAMENAADEVKDVASTIIGPNTSESLLDTIEILLKENV